MAQVSKEQTQLPYYCFYNEGFQKHFEGRFWNCQGKQIAIVACITEGIDWAAYIGTDAPNSYHEDNTLRYVAKWGCKLLENDARYFFPSIKLRYRG